jgi:hypothetical protein
VLGTMCVRVETYRLHDSFLVLLKVGLYEVLGCTVKDAGRSSKCQVLMRRERAGEKRESGQDRLSRTDLAGTVDA